MLITLHTHGFLIDTLHLCMGFLLIKNGHTEVHVLDVHVSICGVNNLWVQQGGKQSEPSCLYVYYRMMNFNLSIVMYGDASFKHTLIKTLISLRV